MTSEGTSTVPRMGSFRRVLLGYCRPDVDEAISARDMSIEVLRQEVAGKAEIEAELESLSGMVIEREREIRGLNEQLRQADERYDRSIASLDAVSARLQEIEAQARGQATRIRMKALREAVEVGRRAQELSEAEGAVEALEEAAVEHEEAALANGHAKSAGHDEVQGSAANGRQDISQETFEGTIKVEIGPLGDYSQLVGIEDAIERLGANEISIERFSEGRATLKMNLDEPVDLLRELEEQSPLEFHVRRAADDNLVLDVEDEDSENRAA